MVLVFVLLVEEPVGELVGEPVGELAVVVPTTVDGIQGITSVERRDEERIRHLGLITYSSDVPKETTEVLRIFDRSAICALCCNYYH